MQYLEHFIIHTPKKLQDTKKLGDIDIYIETKFNAFEHRVPFGTVVSTPLKHNTPVKAGDLLYVHHHVMMDDSNDMGDNMLKVKYHPDGGFSTQCYAYKNEEGIHVMSDWVLVEPIEQPNKLKSSIIEIVEFEKQPNRYGKIHCSSEALEEMGIKVGDVVYFSENADYEMEIEGQKLWRMNTGHLLAVIDDYKA
jgi:co-chaperonin GroES (HSP10)